MVHLDRKLCKSAVEQESRPVGDDRRHAPGFAAGTRGADRPQGIQSLAHAEDDGAVRFCPTAPWRARAHPPGGPVSGDLARAAVHWLTRLMVAIAAGTILSMNLPYASF